jgi:hypothetical protein
MEEHVRVVHEVGSKKRKRASPETEAEEENGEDEGEEPKSKEL